MNEKLCLFVYNKFYLLKISVAKKITFQQFTQEEVNKQGCLLCLQMCLIIVLDGMSYAIKVQQQFT